MPILCRFVSGFQKCHLFLCTTIRNAKKCISKMWRHHLYLVFWPLHRQKQRYCFEILHACCLYVSRSHIFRFFENFPRFGKYLKKSKFLVEKSQDLEIFPFWKFRDSSFLCQAFLYLWPDFEVSRLLIWFSAIFSPLTSFRPKMDEHDLRLTSITRDLIWPRTQFFQGMREIDVGRGTENGAAKFAAVFGLSTKNHRGGGLWPPIGSRVKRHIYSHLM